MTAPLVPACVDLRDFPFMPMEFGRLFASDTWTLSTDTEKVAAITLWGKSWSQVPAGSLPDDDRLLAAHSGAGPRWKRVKDMALRGWRKGGDGRLYHPVVCEKALEAWLEKLSQRLSSGAGNAKRWGIEFDPTEIEAQITDARGMLAALNPQSKALSKRKPPGVPSGSKKRPDRNPKPVPSGIPLGSQETGTGNKDQKQDPPSPVGNSEILARGCDETPSPTNRPPKPRSANALACIAMRKAGAARVNPSHPVLLAGLDEGATPAMYGDAVREAIEAGKGEPFAYAIATVRSRIAEAKRAPTTPGAAHARPHGPRKSLADQTLEWAAEQHATGVPLDPDDRPLRPPLDVAVR